MYRPIATKYMIECKLSEDGKTILSLDGYGELVVPPTVEKLGCEIRNRNQISKLVFSEGCTKIGPEWDIDGWIVIDHDAILEEIILPSTMKEVAQGAFSEFCCIKYVWVPVGMKDYFKGILPERLAECVVEQGRRDENNVIYSMDGKTLIKAPEDLKGIYTCVKGTEVIGEWAFLSCREMTGIVLPKTLKKIAEYAFMHCGKLKTIDIPDSVKEIGDYAFEDCGIDKTVIPNSVKNLGKRAFYRCTELTNVVLPDTVKEIDLSDCSRMTSFVIPVSMKEFSLPGSLVSVSVAEGNKLFDSRGDCNAVIETATNKLVYGCQNTVIPDSVVEIGEGAFKNCSIKSVILPDSVEKIGESAFWGCKSLTSIVIPASVKIIGENAFSFCAGLTSIKVAKGNTVFDSRDDCNAIIETKTNKLIFGCKTTVIPDSVIEIGECSFKGCWGLKSVSIPNSVTVIGKDSFSGCSGLNSVIIPKSAKTIGEHAFGFCFGFNEEIRRWDGLESVIIEADLEEIDMVAFDNHVKYLTLKGDIDNVRESIAECIRCLNDLETIYVPYGKIDYYKSKLPGKFHKLLKTIPEEEKKK